MARKHSVGIDIGTYQVKVMVAEEYENSERSFARVIGTGFAESKGLRHGYIINQLDVEKALRQAIAQAEKTSGLKIKSAYMSMGGIGLSSVISTGTAVITKADSEVTDLDIDKAIEAAKNAIPPALSLNRKVIHSIAQQYKIDGKVVLGLHPAGMKGAKLEVKVLFITCLENHLNDLIQVIEDCDVTVENIVASPLAAAMVTLTKTQKVAGSVLANIGAETISVIVYENNIPVSLEVFPLGSSDITNDIALGFKVPIEEAERIKLGALTNASIPKKKLDDIVEARLSDIFELIEEHLKKIGRSGLLPAGIILTGGGSGINFLEEAAKSSLNLPSKIASMNWSGNMKEPIKDASWSVVYGLCRLGLEMEDEESALGIQLARRAGNGFLNWIRQFLP